MRLSTLYENKKAAKKYAYIVRSAPSNKEIGFIGHTPNKKFTGDKESVQIEFDPSDPDIKDNYVYHTHPVGPEGPNPIRALPSEQDLISAVENAHHGLVGLVIYNGNYYTVIVPTTRVKGKMNVRNYIKALNRGDIEDALKALERLGFDIETGEL